MMKVQYESAAMYLLLNYGYTIKHITRNGTAVMVRGE